jgi:hypothetical protein
VVVALVLLVEYSGRIGDNSYGWHFKAVKVKKR